MWTVWHHDKQSTVMQGGGAQRRLGDLWVIALEKNQYVVPEDPQEAH